MKWLDAILPQQQAEQRTSFSEWLQDFFTFGGRNYPLGYQTTWAKDLAEPVSADFVSYVTQGLAANPVVFALERVLTGVFSEARFLFQRFNSGRPGDLFGTPDLAILEQPWPGGTTGDLLARMQLTADMAGNCYVARVGGELALLRPDWVEIALAERLTANGDRLGVKRIGYWYYEGGPWQNREPVFLMPSEVCHYAPYPDPVAPYRGMSWITPVVRELQADSQATRHKLKWWENAATPNLSVSWGEAMTVEQFEALVEAMDRSHQGVDNAYKTLYTAAGADVTVLGADMRQMDFRAVQGAGETRLAAASGVGAVIAQLSEGLQGSALNSGNYTAAKRRFADGTMRPLWRNVAGSLQTLVRPPRGSRLWYDTRDVAFLREDAGDLAAIQSTRAQTIRTYTDAGFTPESAVAAVLNDDEALLTHSGLFSVQLQPPGSGEEPPEDTADADETDVTNDQNEEPT